MDIFKVFFITVVILCSCKQIKSNSGLAKNHLEINNSKEIKSFEDSVCKVERDSFKCLNHYISYYDNGKIMEKGCQGIYNGMGTPVGTWFEYDSLSHLKKTIFYHPDIFGKDYKIVKEFNNIGQLLSTEIFNNDAQYETSIKKLKRIP